MSVAGLGSGVLVSADGKVPTAAHLVHTADEIIVEFLSGTVVGATVVASEPEADVALLQLERVPEGAVVRRVAQDKDHALHPRWRSQHRRGRAGGERVAVQPGAGTPKFPDGETSDREFSTRSVVFSRLGRR